MLFIAMEASWTYIFWLLLTCIIVAIILITICCYLRKQCRTETETEGKQEKSSFDRMDSIRTQVSICSVWTVDEVGQQGNTDLGRDTAEEEASPPEMNVIQSDVSDNNETVIENHHRDED